MNGDIIAAASEERFSRIKGDSSFPHNAVGYCLEEAGIDIEEVDYIVFYEDSIIKFDRLVTMFHVTASKGVRLFGVGEWATSTYGIGRENDIQIVEESRYPNSVGLLYSAFT